MERLSESLAIGDLSSIILNNAFDAIVYYLPVKNQTGAIVDFEFAFINDTAFKILSGTREDYMGQKFLSLFPYAIKDGMYEDFKKTAETGDPSENVYYYESGEYKGWYRDSIIKHGEGIIVYFRDVTEQKHLEIELENKTRELEKLLREKEILLKESHHRIKNNLQLISSMLNLQSNSIEDPFYREILNTSRQRITNIAKIHQRLYEDQVYTSVNLNLLLEDTVMSLFNIYYDKSKNIELKYDVDNVEVNLNYSVNIALIINELITNCIKYAFEGITNGEIIIKINQQESKIRLIISDNGTGMPKDFNFENLNSIGLTLVKSLVEQMDGTVEITGPPGTTFLITLLKQA